MLIAILVLQVVLLIFQIAIAQVLVRIKREIDLTVNQFVVMREALIEISKNKNS